ncbi:IS3 family transposase, partial [Candidatus Poribacteria bacterium]
MIETVRNASSYSVRQICETLGFNRSLLYYHPKSTPSQGELREKIEALSLRYPKYGYRRITALLLRQGYSVGYRRVARLMKEENLSVSIKRVCRTTRSLEGPRNWVNSIENLDICRQDQVWVGDITYVRLNQ